MAEMGIADMPVLLPATVGPLRTTSPFDKPAAWGGCDLRRAVAIKTVRVAMAVCPVFLFAGQHSRLIAPVAGAGH